MGADDGLDEPTDGGKTGHIVRSDLERRWWFWKGQLPRIHVHSEMGGETWG